MLEKLKEFLVKLKNLFVCKSTCICKDNNICVCEKEDESSSDEELKLPDV